MAGQAGAAEVVLYTEDDGIAVITLNRPHKKNTLNDAVIQGVADGIDAATRSPDVRAVVLRGAGDTFTAGYDLDPGVRTDGGPDDQPGWSTPYGAPAIDTRPRAWDPVRDWQFMGHNVRRFMKVWECPKPVLGEIRGWAVGGATDLVLCCDLLYMADDAYIGYAPSRIFGTPTTMMWVYRLGLEHAKQFLLTGRAIDAGTAFRIGLVSAVLPPEDLSAHVEAEARMFRHIPANQLALNKLLVNQAFENMGLRTSQLLGTFFDGVTRHTEEARQWVESFATKGFRQVIRERDAPWGDYGERRREGPADEGPTDEGPASEGPAEDRAAAAAGEEQP
jgi:enoyl-CoA hydratase